MPSAVSERAGGWAHGDSSIQSLLTAPIKCCLMIRMGKNDFAVIRAILAGDKEAYGALVERHSHSLFRVAFRITGNEAHAEDVVQEAFLRGYQKLESFEARSSFGTWIYRIAVRGALDRISRRPAVDPSRVAGATDPE